MAFARKQLSFVFIAIFLSCGEPLAGGADLPSVADVLAVHRENCERLATIHLQVALKEGRTDAYANSWRHTKKQNQLISDLIESGELTDENLDVNARAAGMTVALLKQSVSETLRHNIAESPGPYVSYFEVFLRGDDYQVRSPIRSSKETKEWRSPAASVTAESLITDYARVRIHSRSTSLEPPVRIWCGADSFDLPRHALVMAGYYSEADGTNLPPYMQPLHPAWDYEHPIDAFFSAPAENYRVVRQEEVDGRTLTVVEALVPKPTTLSRVAADGQQEQVPQVDFHCAWLDLDRGAIPMKLEQSVSSEGTDFDQASGGSPLSVCTTKEVKSLPDGAFYPVTTVQEHYGPSYDDAGPVDFSSVVHRRMTWNCTLVETSVPGDEKFFVLNFPAGQTFYDYDAKKVVGALEPVEALTLGQLAPPLNVARWLDGQERTLADFQGRVVVIEFWGLWCSACRNGVPALKELQAKYQDRPVTFIAIHTAGGDADALQKRIQKYGDEQQWEFLHAIDAGTMIEDSATTHAYGVKGFPGQFVIAPDGMIAFSDEIVPDDAAGIKDLLGKSYEELTRDQLKRLEEHSRRQFADAGVEPPAADASIEDQIISVSKVTVHRLSKQIDAALEKPHPAVAQ